MCFGQTWPKVRTLVILDMPLHFYCDCKCNTIKSHFLRNFISNHLWQNVTLRILSFVEFSLTYAMLSETSHVTDSPVTQPRYLLGKISMSVLQNYQPGTSKWMHGGEIDQRENSVFLEQPSRTLMLFDLGTWTTNLAENEFPNCKPRQLFSSSLLSLLLKDFLQFCPIP
jgi:hypothetical protein